MAGKSDGLCVSFARLWPGVPARSAFRLQSIFRDVLQDDIVMIIGIIAAGFQVIHSHKTLVSLNELSKHSTTPQRDRHIT